VGVGAHRGDHLSAILYRGARLGCSRHVDLSADVGLYAPHHGSAGGRYPGPPVALADRADHAIVQSVYLLHLLGGGFERPGTTTDARRNRAARDRAHRDRAGARLADDGPVPGDASGAT